MSKQICVQSVMRRIRVKGTTVIVYEPTLEDVSTFFGSKVVIDVKRLKRESQTILAKQYKSC